MTQKILSIDGQVLNTYQLCARRMKYAFIDNVHPEQKAEALESGDLMHKMLEVYYSLQLDDFDFQTETWHTIKEAGLIPPTSREFYSIKDFAIKCGRFFGINMNIQVEDVEEVIHHFFEYTDYFQHDTWHPLAVEEVGSKVLFEDERIKIIYNFKIDLIAEQGRIIAPFDHKTSRRRSEASSLSNQFIGYCYGLGLNNLVVNKIGFQKTLSPQQRFNRSILTIDDDRIKEWVVNTVHWCARIIESELTNEYDMNLTSCDKYSGCIFARLCESDPASRFFKIERDFKIGDDWDVAKHLEAKNKGVR